jgi:hypothetical protein
MEAGRTAAFFHDIEEDRMPRHFAAGVAQCGQNKTPDLYWNQQLPMASNSDLLAYIDRLRSAQVLCVGDFMLDHYSLWAGRAHVARSADPGVVDRARN